MTLRNDERQCSHPGGYHPYHYAKRWEDGEKVYEDFICGYCYALVRTMRVK